MVAILFPVLFQFAWRVVVPLAVPASLAATVAAEFGHRPLAVTLTVVLWLGLALLWALVAYGVGRGGPRGSFAGSAGPAGTRPDGSPGSTAQSGPPKRDGPRTRRAGAVLRFMSLCDGYLVLTDLAFDHPDQYVLPLTTL